LGKGIELRTNSLHYDLSTNVGTTRDSLQFYSRGANGTARGARFDQKQELLDLSSEVDLILVPRSAKPGSPMETKKFHATSEQAYCAEMMHRIIFQGNARIESNSELISGDRVEVVLNADRTHATSLISTGNATYQSKDADETRALSGDRMVFGIAASGALEKISVSGQAVFSSLSASEEEELRGGEIDLEFDADKGSITQIQGRTGVLFRLRRGTDQTQISGEQLNAKFMAETKNLEGIHVRGRAKFLSEGAGNSARNELRADEIRMTFRDREGRAVSEKLRAEGSAQWISAPVSYQTAAHREPARTLEASFLEMVYSSEGDFLESGSASGNVVISEGSNDQPTRPQVRRLIADSAQFHFFPKSNQMKDMNAEGHVQTTSARKPGPGESSSVEEFRTASEKMQAIFALQNGDSVVDSAAQWGNFSYKDASRFATAGRCDYDSGKEILILKESPQISDEMGRTTGNLVEYDRKRKVLSVHGGVRSILSAKKGEGSFFGSTSSSPGVVTADEMQYWTEGDHARYTGKAQLLSENQQLRAQVLEIYGGGDRVEAQGEVRHVVPGKERSKPASQTNKPKETRNSANGPVTIQSSNLKYLKEDNELFYSGNVSLHSTDLSLTSGTLDAILDKEGKQVERATAREKVLIHQEGGRECKGGKADWYLDPGKYVVIGEPAEVYDPGRGRSFARRLTSFTADDRILLENP
jgi:lipopolysaccharide export system protein LptA